MYATRGADCGPNRSTSVCRLTPFSTGTEPLRILGINTRLAMDNLGLSLTHQGEHADYV